jgi:aspartate--ammonia ligase
MIELKDYKTKLDLINTEKAIKIVKDGFEKSLATKLNLIRVTAPLFVSANSGLNDDLSGLEVPVTFTLKNEPEPLTIVHSLAKWKRMAINRYNLKPNQGLYTDMNAIRKDETLDNLHSIYVDQWDWERVITKQDRNLNHLKTIVNLIYDAIKETAAHICSIYPNLENYFPDEIHFLTTSELEAIYPNLSSKERETEITKKYGAVCLMQIGGILKNGDPHDLRAPDYDDWDLNCDILIYYPPLEIAVELSSMGIRVDKSSLLKQLELTNKLEKLKYPYHQMIMNDELPFTIGGGIGQSRLCLVMLNKVHIGEVQSSYWDKKNLEYAKINNIKLL